MPVALFVLGFPNLYNVRYFMGSWIVLILLTNHWLHLWLLQDTRFRTVGLMTMAAFIALNLLATTHFLKVGRGHYRDIARLIAAGDPPTYAANREDNQTFVMDYYAAVLGLRIAYVPPDGWCAARPTWLIMTLSAFPDRLTYGPPGCTADFTKAATFPATGFGLYPWVVYRRAN
jgi:hypothetical protein